MLCHDDLLVDGDRCSVLLRMPGATNLLMPAEAESVPSVPALALQGLSIPSCGLWWAAAWVSVVSVISMASR